MREGFRGYFQPSKSEFDTLWAEGEVVVDTNVLLNLFRYPVALRDDLLKILRERADRLWLPHQVAREFHDRRWNVVGEQEGKFDAIDRALLEARSPVSEAIEKLHRLPAAESAELKSQFDKALQSFEEALARHKSSWGSHDEIFDAVTSLYEGKVGSPYTREELDTAHTEGADRFEKQIPPGFKDQTKSDDRQYGDYILWKQLLDHSREAESPVIFVTDDGKEDWWVKTSGKQRMPRPELVEEFFSASGQRIHIYNVKRFLSFAEERGLQVSQAATEEARRAQEINEREAYSHDAARRDSARRRRGAAALHPSGYTLGAAARMDRVVDSISSERLDEIRRAYEEYVSGRGDALTSAFRTEEAGQFARSVGDRLGLGDADYTGSIRRAAELAGLDSEKYEALKRAASGYASQGAIARSSEQIADGALGVSARRTLLDAQIANRMYIDSLVSEGIVTDEMAHELSLSELRAYERAYRLGEGEWNNDSAGNRD